MAKGDRQNGGPAQVADSHEPQRALRPPPGKVTRTSKLSPGHEPAVQRKAGHDRHRRQARTVAAAPGFHGGPVDGCVRVEKRWKNQSASGEVIARADEEPSQPSKEQETLAGSRAWLALGRTFLASGDAESAVECARRGLETLGDDYASPRSMTIPG